MEKLKIGNTEFDLVPMGIIKDTQGKTRSFKFTTDSSYADVLTCVSLQSNFNQIQHIGNDENPVNTYADAVSFKSLGYEKGITISDGVTADVYTVTYSIDEVLSTLKNLSTQLSGYQTQLAENKTLTEATFSAVDYILTERLA